MRSVTLLRVKSQEYVLRVNVVLGDDTRRFCEIRAKNDDVYVFQPEKGINRAKISYHASGQRHLKLGNGPAMFVRHDDQPAWIRSEKDVFAKSLENFSTLLRYKGELADDKFDLELPSASPTTMVYIEVSIGRTFDSKDWKHLDVRAVTLSQKDFVVLHSPSALKICVRLFQMQPA